MYQRTFFDPCLVCKFLNFIRIQNLQKSCMWKVIFLFKILFVKFLTPGPLRNDSSWWSSKHIFHWFLLTMLNWFYKPRIWELLHSKRNVTLFCSIFCVNCSAIYSKASHVISCDISLKSQIIDSLDELEEKEELICDSSMSFSSSTIYSSTALSCVHFRVKNIFFKRIEEVTSDFSDFEFL